MQFEQRTVLGLYDSSQKRFTIPVYQRAYSWEIQQWKDLLDDIKEQLDSANNYSLGNVLLEMVAKDREYEVIDGQQRLTTIVIFLSALFGALSGKYDETEIKNRKKIYLKHNSNTKLRIVDYDMPFFEAFIITGKNDIRPNSVSQRRIKRAYEYFSKEFLKEDIGTLVKILEKFESSEITCVVLDEKKQSALMFELQNNRGKDLTNMEKLKSYLMYQVYRLSESDETNDNVEHLSELFKQIYLVISDLPEKISEDSVLTYHCQAYINGYNYRTINDIKNAYNKSKSIKWINNFTEELYSSFLAMKRIEKSRSKYWKLLGDLNRQAFIYPFIIKGSKYFSDDDNKMEELLRILEILSFRYLFINSRADFLSRLQGLLTGFKGDVSELRIKTQNLLNETYYWSDFRFKEYLDNPIYGNKTLNYILWQYEESIQNSGYHVANTKISNEQIEHISPQTPTDGNSIESGYEVNEQGEYPEGYDKYIHSIGNLVLISGSHNSSIKNVKFQSKLDSYKSNPLLNQQAEIYTFASGTEDKPIWDRRAIEKRKQKLKDFCIKRWSFDS
jgi:uncharacterized protein with ParB-like and HNH nuclease domain